MGAIGAVEVIFVALVVVAIIAVLVLRNALAKKRDPANLPVTITSCRRCGQSVSSRTPVCMQCGEPRG
jgi:hypothetical protein